MPDPAESGLRADRLKPSSDASPGTILAAHGNRLRIAAGTNAIDVTEIQREGKRPMSTREFLAGHRIAAGERVTPEP